MTPAAPPTPTAWRALGRRRFLLTAWPWRALLHTLLTFLAWVCLVLPAVVLVLPFGGAVDALRGPGTDVVAAAGLLLLGLALAFVALPLLASPLLAVDRARARLVDPRPLPPSGRAPRGLARWLRDRYLTPGRWRHAAYLVVTLAWQTALIAVLVLLGTSAGALLAAPVLASRSVPINVGPWQANTPAETWSLVVLGALLLVVLVYGWTLGACLQVALLRWTLVSDRAGELEARLTEVAASRARLVDSFDSERRRIERDLHDGAQQRLVTLAMNLGVARMEVTDTLGDEHPATVAVAAAHEQSKALMDELRAFVRGIHPQVLSDVGLVAALDQLTVRDAAPGGGDLRPAGPATRARRGDGVLLHLGGAHQRDPAQRSAPGLGESDQAGWRAGGRGAGRRTRRSRRGPRLRADRHGRPARRGRWLPVAVQPGRRSYGGAHADPGEPMTRVVLAEDGTLLREGLVEVLRKLDFDVVAAVGDAGALLAAVAEHRPDLVVTDIRMPPGFGDEGLRAACRLREEYGALPVVALSQYVERSYAEDLLDSEGGRAVGYLLKDRVVDVAEFGRALRTVVGGGTVVDPEVVRQLLRTSDPLDRLTEREREVLALLAEGHSNLAIAQRLVVTEAAVNKHVGNILAKLDLPPSPDENRRVLAVLTWLRRRP